MFRSETTKPISRVQCLIFGITYMKGTEVKFITSFVEKKKTLLAKLRDFDKLRQEKTQTGQDKDLRVIILAYTIGNRKRYR